MQYRAQYSGGSLRIMANHLPAIGEGEMVSVTIEQVRSDNTHRHQFAWLADAWSNPPETVAFEPWAATKETLRKHALCQTGFYEQAIIECGDPKLARTVAQEIMNARKRSEGYAHAIVRGGVAVIRWPESQSYKAMGKERFQRSKEAILNWIADQIGVDPEDLRRVA
ncbi:MAG: hypothetical protein AAGK66_07365 [Pseudomonadota bacterium]